MLAAPGSARRPSPFSLALAHPTAQQTPGPRTPHPAPPAPPPPALSLCSVAVLSQDSRVHLAYSVQSTTFGKMRSFVAFLLALALAAVSTEVS